MKTLDKIFGTLAVAGIGTGIYTIDNHTTVNHADAYASAAAPDELRKCGINDAKKALNGKDKRIEENNFVIRVKAHNCIVEALKDCSSNLKAAATEGLEQCTTTENYELGSADLECIQDKQRQEALKACAQLVETNQ